MFKNDKEGKEICRQKINDQRQKSHHLENRIKAEEEKFDNVWFKTEAHREVERREVLIPLFKKLDKCNKKIRNQYQKLNQIEDSKYCLEERKQRQALKKQEIDKISHVKMNVPSIYHDGTLFEYWTGKKIERKWNESMKSNSNEQPGCSHWDRRDNQTPFTSPFGKR